MDEENEFDIEAENDELDENGFEEQYRKRNSVSTFVLNPKKFLKFNDAIKIARSLCDMMEGVKFYPLDPKRQLFGYFKLYSPALILRDVRLLKLLQLFELLDSIHVYSYNGKKIIITCRVENIFIKI